MNDLHKNAFWIYGVIVALAIREPLSPVIHHYLSAGLSNWQVQLEMWRMLVFLVLIIRFYLGAGLYFDEVYLERDPDWTGRKKSYPIDFLSGLFHFLLFFACSVTLTVHNRMKGELSFFSFGLLAILLYDNVWYVATRLSKLETCERIKSWMHFNNATAITSTVVYAVVRVLLNQDPVFSDHMAFFPILLFSLYDLKQLMVQYERHQQPPPRTVGAAAAGAESVSRPDQLER